MKLIKYIFILLATITIGCSKDDAPVAAATNVLEGTVLVAEMTNDTHKIELYRTSATLVVGENKIFFKVKDNATGQYISDATLTWFPVMKMTTKTHSCPKMPIVKSDVDDKVYVSTFFPQMISSETEPWNIKIDYTIGETSYTANANLAVVAPVGKTTLKSGIMGTDGKKYVMVLKQPASPRIGVNDMAVYLFTMQDLMNFPMVNGYSIKIDPRMPSMGNHSSPNNVNLSQSAAEMLYEGKLNLTMSGLWRINLQLLNADGVVVSGNAVTEEVTTSPLFFEIEF